MSGLPEELRREVEKIVKKELDAAGALSSLPNGLLTAQDARYSADRIARRAAELAVEHMKELVCDYCGRPHGQPHINCEGALLIGTGTFKEEIDLYVTRAEFERRKEGRNG